MKKKAKKALVSTIGVIFIILGFVGLVIPFLQGIIFLTIGFILLSISSPQINKWTKDRVKHLPRLTSIINKTETWVTKFIESV